MSNEPSPDPFHLPGPDEPRQPSEPQRVPIVTDVPEQLPDPDAPTITPTPEPEQPDPADQ